MATGNDRLSVRGSSLLSRRDWVYLLSLLVPFAVYDLILRGSLIASRPEDPGLIGSIGMMRSDLLFNLGYALLWVGLFAVARKGLSRLIIVVLFHSVTVLIALFTACAYRYFIVTGSTLDSDFILLWFSSPEGTGGAIASEVTRGLLLLILAVLIYAVLGPPMVVRFVARWRGWSAAGTRTVKVPWLRLAGVGLTTYALFSFSLLPGGESAGASKSFSRDPVVNVVMTADDVTEGEAVPEEVAADVPTEPPPEARLRPTSESERRNVVLIFLESTRAGATTPYNRPLKTTPFMDELAKSIHVPGRPPEEGGVQHRLLHVADRDLRE
jgi:lipoteichoic acid synthase